MQAEKEKPHTIRRKLLFVGLRVLLLVGKSSGVVGGSGVDISGVISPRVMSIATLLITLLITTHELRVG